MARRMAWTPRRPGRSITNATAGLAPWRARCRWYHNASPGLIYPATRVANNARPQSAASSGRRPMKAILPLCENFWSGGRSSTSGRMRSKEMGAIGLQTRIRQQSDEHKGRHCFDHGLLLVEEGIYPAQKRVSYHMRGRERLIRNSPSEELITARVEAPFFLSALMNSVQSEVCHFATRQGL